jgi:F0F1-type ATP synthase epsilon subunit
MSDQPKNEQLTVKARAPFHVYYEGPAKSLTATNRIGEFDILPDHADFFSLLKPGEIFIETDSDPITFTIRKGMISVRDNEVLLFVDM